MSKKQTKQSRKTARRKAGQRRAEKILDFKRRLSELKLGWSNIGRTIEEALEVERTPGLIKLFLR